MNNKKPREPKGILDVDYEVVSDSDELATRPPKKKPGPKPAHKHKGHDRRTGAKNTGRPAGSRNKKSLALVDSLEEEGCHPEKFLAEQMQNESLPMGLRVQCAMTLMGYRWPKPVAVQVQVSEDNKTNWSFKPEAPSGALAYEQEDPDSFSGSST